MANLDHIDIKLLGELQEHGRITNVELAQRVGLTAPPCLRRVRSLEEDGVIRGYHAQVAAPGEGGVKAFLELFYQNARCQDYVERMREYPEIRHCSGISGETDMLVLVEAPSMARLSEVRAAIEAFPQMQRVKTHIVVQDWPL